MKKILIIGLGLIGSSLAVNIKKTHPEHEIFGIDNDKTLQIALENDIIDKQMTNLTAASQMDFIILAVPIRQILDYLDKLSKLELKENVIITDTGSTKAEIVQFAAEKFAGKSVKFIGGHPMAGSHKSGVLAADEHLFENAYYVLTEENQDLTNLFSGLLANFIIVKSDEHDRATSAVSHFPHILASNLVQNWSKFSTENPLAKMLAAGGFRDMTRIAEANPQMWTSIFLSNRTEILDRMSEFEQEFHELRSNLTKADETFLLDFFEKGHEIRKNMEIRQGSGSISYDLFVSVPDQKGIVLRVLTILQDISITNVKINEENRADVFGVLQISFKNSKDLTKAQQILQKDFEVKIG